MVKKLGVLGTCFSRNFLNSSDYFNPDYKNYYSVAFTQFHSSLIALNTKKKWIDIDQYEDIPKEKRRFVIEDFQKQLFDTIKEKKVDYLIIDLYSDALKNIGFFNQEQAVTISPIIEQSRIKEDLSFEFVLDHKDETLFLKTFQEAIKSFHKKFLHI
ncbi:DUF6270 domain-containing protein [Listeria aquatica]|uniref:DUF6270 domain-containing protein n=1 Tax=Listeria aquatica TaxID=1494960 RepID=UPI001FD4CA99|nr:DUF6270 domain-containing protein [Listeria aquatica]